MKRSDKKKQYHNVAAFQEGWQLANKMMEQAIKETPGIGKTLLKRILEKREQIARRSHG